MKNTIKVFSIFIFTIFVTTCNNYFHDLIPPDDNRITRFEIDGQTEATQIGDNVISVFVDKGTDITSVIPRVSVSHKATLIPVTLDYIRAAFPSADLLQVAMGINRTADIAGYVIDLVKENPDFTVPSLTIPIDFSGPVTMLILSGRGTIRQYTVNIVFDTPRLLGFSFNKYDNPELVVDARGFVNEANRTVTVYAVYPAEMSALSYALIPSFEMIGDSLEVEGVPIVSGSTKVQFTPGLGNKSKTITVIRDDEATDYALTVTFMEDPDTIRSITDFRFNKGVNAISAHAVGSIINTENTGTISVQVYYSGVKPLTLTPHFVSPGTVSVGGVTQNSGANSHDFSAPLEYRVVSKNGMYTRTYTVKVEFISLTDAAPRITSFKFSAALNAELVQDADGEIGDGYIYIDAHYNGTNAPVSLIPEFTAEGLVTAYGGVQVSGASPQDFTRQIKYTVTNPGNTNLTRDYWVSVHMIRDTSSDASITMFGFYKDDNSGLADNIIGKIDQVTSKITVYAPVGSGTTTRTMYPRFTAAGQVSVAGTPQVSGVSGRLFDSPLLYTVVSANGKNTRTYMVTVRELQTTIYVKHDANGMNDGMSWQDAFISLKAACDAAAEFPEDVPKEIWIARGTYTPGNNAGDYFPLTANTSYLGGFAGTETAKSQRNVAANIVTISGDLGGGTRMEQLFHGTSVNGDLLFENLRLKYVWKYGIGIERGTGNIEINNLDIQDVSGYGFGIFCGGTLGSIMLSNITANNLSGNNAVYISGTQSGVVLKNSNFKNGKGLYFVANPSRIEVSNVSFNNISAGDALHFVAGGNVVIDRVNIDGVQGDALYIGGVSNIAISNSSINSVNGYGLSINNSISGNITIDGFNLRDISGYGIYCNCNSNRVQLSNITATNVGNSNSYAVFVPLSQRAIFLEDSNFINVGGIYLKTDTSNPIEVRSINITGVSRQQALYIEGGSDVLADDVHIDGVPNGQGMMLTTNGNITVSNSSIRNCYSLGSSARFFGAGLCMIGTGNKEISDCTISGNTAFYGGGVFSDRGNLTMNSCTISGNIAKFAGGGVFKQHENFTMNGGTISNNTTTDTDDFGNETPTMSYTGGGGVYVFVGTFTMNGGTISGNTTNDRGGGGVYVSSSTNVTFTKTGGTIYGNDGTANANTVRNELGAIVNGRGHAVYIISNNGSATYIDTTLGPSDNFSW